jgi:predicted outer membrane repeat protein
MTDIKIGSSTFTEIAASESAGLVLTTMRRVVIDNCSFSKLQTNNGAGSAVQVTFNPLETSPSLTLSSSTFRLNRVEVFRGGSVHISLSIMPLILTVQSCEFSDNYSLSGGSSLYIESSVRLDVASSITTSKFFNNKDSDLGTFTGLISNTLNVDNCEFYSNDSNANVINLTLTTNLSRVAFTACRLHDNKGSSVVLVRGKGKGSQVSFASSSVVRNSTKYTMTLDSTSAALSLSSLSLNSGPMLLITGYLTATDAKWTKNTNVDPAGAINLTESSELLCIRCEFSENQASNGGAIRIDSKSLMVVKSSSITLNKTTESGSALYILNSKVDNVIENTSITLNSSSGAASIFMIESYLTIRGVTLSSNTDTYNCPGISTLSSTVKVYNSTFQSQSSSLSAFFTFAASSTVSFENVVFNQGTSALLGGLGDFSDSSGSFLNCTVSDIDSGSGSALVLSNSDLSLNRLTASKFKSINQGSLINMTGKSLSIRDSNVAEFKQTAIVAQSMINISIVSSVFQDGRASTETVMSVVNFKTATIDRSTIKDNIADTDIAGLSFTVLNNWADNSTLLISNCSFVNNSASEIAALYTDVRTANISHSTFELNRATTASGGAIELACEVPSPCNLSVSFSNFTSNSAVLNGGAIYWTKKEPLLLNNTYTNNSAAYGSDFASFGVSLKSLDFSENASNRVYKVIGETYLGIGSGQKLPQSISIALIDQTGQVITTDNSSIASIAPVDIENVTITGETRVQAKSGVYYFSNVKISASPGQDIQLKVTSDALTTLPEDATGYGEMTGLSFDASVRECESGEALVGKDCVRCEYSTYSIDPALACATCPTGATCYGGDLMSPKAGYWRPSKHSDQFFACPNSAACLGSPHITLNLTGECALGYRGNKCQACDNGYSRSAENTCSSCPDSTINAVRLAGIMIGVALACGVLVKSTLSTAYEPKLLHSIYIKIFTNYLQLIVLTTQLNLAWPSFVYVLFNTQKSAANVTDQVFSVDCMLADGTDKSYQTVYFNKLKIIMFIPPTLALTAFIFWSLHYYNYRRVSVFKKQFVATLVVLFFLFHPSIVKANFAVFSCTQILSGELWLTDNLDIKCYGSMHTYYAVTVALPALVIWGISLPVLVLLYLRRHRTELQTLMMKLRFGFLYTGYKSSNYYWEFVIIYRKIIIICCVVFIGNFSVHVQALSIMLVISAFAVLHHFVQPYSNSSLNDMEMRAILVAAVTIYCGLFYLTGNLNEVAKIFFFVVMVGINVYFFKFFLKQLTISLKGTVFKALPWLRRCLKSELHDNYPDAVAVVHPTSTNTTVMNLEKVYTLVSAQDEPQVFLSSKVEMKTMYLNRVVSSSQAK